MVFVNDEENIVFHADMKYSMTAEDVQVWSK